MQQFGGIHQLLIPFLDLYQPFCYWGIRYIYNVLVNLCNFKTFENIIIDSPQM